MKLVLRMVLTMAFMAALVATASAQGQRQQRQGGGFGFGGGGAMMVHSMVATNKVLQEELKVTDEQKKKLDDAMKTINEKRREMFTGGFNRNASAEERKEMMDKMTKLNEETKKTVEGALDEKQNKRLTEISYQMMGFAAYTNKDVQEALKLNESQKEKLTSIAEEYQKDSMELLRDAPRTRTRPGQEQTEEQKQRAAEFTKKREALRKEAEDKASEVLTAEQRKTWKDLQGEKFDTAKLMQGFQRPMRPDNN